MNFIQITENIYRATAPYKDIFTTMYLVKTPAGALLFDTASFDSDAKEYTLPFLTELLKTSDDLKFIFISHNHLDHAGGLSELIKSYPNATIVSRCPRLKEKFDGHPFICPEDGDTLLEFLKVVTIPGHTADSEAILDTRDNILITGDCLQLYGIFGSGLWASNINFPDEHKSAVEKVRKMNLDRIVTAHDYHPYGYDYNGNENVNRALDACIDALLMIKKLIADNPSLDDDAISELFSNNGALPNIAPRIVKAIRASNINPKEM